jgi:hypothetical protein
MEDWSNGGLEVWGLSRVPLGTSEKENRGRRRGRLGRDASSNLQSCSLSILAVTGENRWRNEYEHEHENGVGEGRFFIVLVVVLVVDLWWWLVKGNGKRLRER